MYKLSFFVPKKYLKRVKEGLFEVGAGKWGRYDRCSWETAGRGQFRPLEGSSPSSGKIGKIKRVKEFKVEMICGDDIIEKTVRRLKELHPYEEPAYDVIRENG